MAGWNTSSIWIKVALVTLCVGIAVYIIGFATGTWLIGYYRYRSAGTAGLWPASQGSIHFGGYDWFRVVQALECIGLILLGVALLLLVIYMCAVTVRRRNVLIATVVISFTAVFFVMVGVAVFASKGEKYGLAVGWSMGIAIAGGILAFVSAIMQTIELCGKC